MPDHAMKAEAARRTNFGRQAFTDLVMAEDEASLSALLHEKIALPLAAFLGQSMIGGTHFERPLAASLAQPGRTRGNVLGSTAYPESNDKGGQEPADDAMTTRRRLR